MPPGATGSGVSVRLTTTRSKPDALTELVTVRVLSAFDDSVPGAASLAHGAGEPPHSGEPASKGVSLGTLAVLVNVPLADAFTFTWMVIVVNSPGARPSPARVHVTFGDANEQVNPFDAMDDT